MSIIVPRERISIFLIIVRLINGGGRHDTGVRVSHTADVRSNLHGNACLLVRIMRAPNQLLLLHNLLLTLYIMNLLEIADSMEKRESF